MNKIYYIFLYIILGSSIYSQSDSLTKSTLFEKYRFDFAVPDQPAFNILGANPSNILRPANVSEVAVIVSDLFKDKSLFIPKSLSVEVAPFLLIKAGTITFQEYINNTWFNSLRVSVGTTNKSSGAGSKYNLAIGLRSTIIDNSKKSEKVKSLLSSIYKALGEELDIDDKIQEKFKNEKGFNSQEQYMDYIKDSKNQKIYTEYAKKEMMNYTDKSDLIEKKVKNLKDAFVEKNWNNTAWDVALAVLFDSKDSLVENLEYKKLTAWTTIAFPLGMKNIWGQMLIGATYKYNVFDSIDVTGSLSTIKRNTGSLSARLNFGQNRLKGFMEIGYSYADIKDKNHNGLFNMGTEINVVGGIWLKFNAGAEFKAKERRNFFTDFDVKFQLPENFNLF